MVDIHSHLIYGVDDGPATLEQSVQMLELAVASGTTDIVATPHANSAFPYRRNVIEERLAELKREFGTKIGIHLGCDLHLSYQNIQDALADTTRYSINGKGHLLVEFSDTLIPPNSGMIFAEMLSRGLTPIITHPERNGLLQNRIRDLARWVEQGCRVQITAQALLGTFASQAKKAAIDLLRSGLVHFVASDAHDTEYRTPRLDLAFDLVSKEFGLDLAHVLFVENPLRALAGESLEYEPFIQYKQRKRRWFTSLLPRSAAC